MAMSMIRLMAAFFVAAVASAEKSTATATFNRKATQDLIEWIRSLDGGLYNPKQEERTFGKDNQHRGIFAKQDIDEGEVILGVPWDSILGAKAATPGVMQAEKVSFLAREQEIIYYNGDETLRFMSVECRAIRNVLREVELGEGSAYAPHLRYLSLLGSDDDDDDETVFPPRIPTLWSEEGRALLEDINDHGVLTPKALFTTLQYDWYGSCIDNVTDPTEAGVAGVVASHGSSGSLLGEFGILVPLLDNYYYNQRQLGNRTLDEQHRNSKSVVQMGESVWLVATRKIVEGEQIYRTFENKKEPYAGELLDFETGDIFRDYGIVDTEIYPKYYYFEIITKYEVDESVGILLDTVKNSDDGDDKRLKLIWVIDDTEEYDWTEIEMYLTRALNRLERIKAVASTKGSTGAPPADSNMSPYEWETAWKYHANLLEAVTLAIDSIGKKIAEEESCPGGMLPSDDDVCPVWDGFDDLPTVPITDLDLEFDPSNPYGPSDVG